MRKALAALLLVVLVLSLVGCGAQESGKEVPVINATGLGKITTKPDSMEVRFSVITQGKDKTVQEENAAKTQKAIDALIALGLTKEEMETRNLNFHPVTKWDQKAGEQIIGYRAENSIVIKTKKLEKAGEITDTAVKSGAEMIGNLTFSLSDEGKEKLLDQAIEKAVQDARRQAESTAKAAGVKIVGIKEINVQKQAEQGPIYYDRTMLRKAAEGASSVATPVLPQDADYIVIVSVAFKIN